MTKPAYDFGKATFFFFQAVGRRPMGAVWIAFWQLLLYVALAALLVVSLQPVADVVIQAIETGVEPEPEDVLAAFGPGLAVLILSPLLWILVLLSVQGAWLRLMTRDEIASGIPLRVGGDELRLLVVNILLILGGIFLSILLSAITAAGGAAIASGANGEPGALAALTGVAWALFLVVFCIWVAIKFASAPALAVRQRRIRFFGAFAASGGVAGWMFLSYLVLIGVAIVVGVIVGVFQQVAMLGGMASLIEPLSQLDNVDGDEAAEVLKLVGEAFAQPGVWIAFGVIMLFQYLFDVIVTSLWHGVGAYVAVRHDGGFDVEPDAVTAPEPAPEPDAAQAEPDAAEPEPEAGAESPDQPEDGDTKQD
jgi:hypothetical protein